MTDRKEPFYFLSLPAHYAWLVVTGEISIIPMGEYLENLPNRLVIHITEPEDQAEQEEIDEFFRNIEGTSEFAPVNALIGWVETRKPIAYEIQKQWARDSDKHGYEGNLGTLKSMNSWGSVYGLKLAKPRLLKDCIYDVHSPEGASLSTLWSPSSPFHEMAGKQALSSLTDALSTESSPS